MSSTDDSVVSARARLNPSGYTRISPKRYSKRISYGAASSRALPVSSRDAKPNADHLAFTPSKGKNCDFVDGVSSGGNRTRKKPVRRDCVVFIVFLALLLDSLLLTCMAPIIPNYLRDSGSEGNEVQPNATSTTPRTDSHSTGQSDPISYLASTNTQLIAMAEELDDWASHQVQHPEHNSSTNRPYTKENTKISLLFASKTLVQVLTNLIVGPLTERIGYTVPMFCGFVVLLLSTVAFAFGQSYELLFAARAFQGMGTAFSTTSGMGLLASLYPDQTERAVAQTRAFSGLALGVLLGPPYGGILYDVFGGKEILCLILAATALFEGVLQLFVMRPRIERGEKRGAPFLKLLMDPYILITAAAITIANLTTAVLEPALPIWMYYTMGAATWLQGVAFVPSTLSYLLFLQLFGFLASRSVCFKISYRWSHTMIGMVLLAVSIAMVPYCPNFYYLIGPMVFMGFGLAQVCTCMLPNIGYLVDHRHEPVYGSAYAITDNAFCIAFALGPAISGPLIDTVGFSWTLRGVSTIILLSAPILMFLRNPPGKQVPEQETSLVETQESTRGPGKDSSYKTTSVDH